MLTLGPEISEIFQLRHTSGQLNLRSLNIPESQMNYFQQVVFSECLVQNEEYAKVPSEQFPNYYSIKKSKIAKNGRRSEYREDVGPTFAIGSEAFCYLDRAYWYRYLTLMFNVSAWAGKGIEIYAFNILHDSTTNRDLPIALIEMTDCLENNIIIDDPELSTYYFAKQNDRIIDIASEVVICDNAKSAFNIALTHWLENTCCMMTKLLKFLSVQKYSLNCPSLSKFQYNEMKSDKVTVIPMRETFIFENLLMSTTGEAIHWATNKCQTTTSIQIIAMALAVDDVLDKILFSHGIGLVTKKILTSDATPYVSEPAAPPPPIEYGDFMPAEQSPMELMQPMQEVKQASEDEFSDDYAMFE